MITAGRSVGFFDCLALIISLSLVTRCWLVSHDCEHSAPVIRCYVMQTGNT